MQVKFSLIFQMGIRKRIYREKKKNSKKWKPQRKLKFGTGGSVRNSLGSFIHTLFVQRTSSYLSEGEG